VPHPRLECDKLFFPRILPKVYFQEFDLDLDFELLSLTLTFKFDLDLELLIRFRE